MTVPYGPAKSAGSAQSADGPERSADGPERSAAIELRHLRKLFDEKIAVADLTLSVERGEVFGFLGPNGAGKTTSVKMLLGLIAPTSGQGWLFGTPLGKPAGRAKVGFLPEHFRFHAWLTATEFLKLHADLYRMPRDVSRERVPALLDLVGLTTYARKKLRTFSKGMLQRIGLAQALLNEPDLVILDEPTSGLDPVGRRLVRDIIRDLRERGTTVVLNSHLLSEVEVTCDRVAFIKRGEVVQISALNSLVEGKVAVEIRARGLNKAIIAGLSRWGQNIRMEQNASLSFGGSKGGGPDTVQLSLTLVGEAELPALNRYLVEHGVEVYALQPEKISLEDLFIQIIGTDGGL